MREYCWPLPEAISAIPRYLCLVRCPQHLHCGASGPSASPEVPSSMEAASPTRAAGASGARREEQPQPSTSNQAHTERPFAPAKAEPISRDAQKALADTVVAFCKSYSLFNQDQMRCAAVLQPETPDSCQASAQHNPQELRLCRLKGSRSVSAVVASLLMSGQRLH